MGACPERQAKGRDEPPLPCPALDPPTRPRADGPAGAGRARTRPRLARSRADQPTEPERVDPLAPRRATRPRRAELVIKHGPRLERGASVLDIACGGGDVAISLSRRASTVGLPLKVEGCDASEEALRFARGLAARRGAGVTFFRLDALRDPIPQGYDVIACSLFLHHLDEDDAVALLRAMADAAGRGVLVNDLERTRAGYWLAWAG